MAIEDAAARGWGPGYPHCQLGAIQVLTRPDGLRVSLRKEILPIVAWLLDETERRGYDVRPGDTWGFACRTIRGSSRPSNHSWGLAIDVNAQTNQMRAGTQGWQGQHDTKQTDMPAWMPQLWNHHQFRWGGDYRGRQDPMHYEFMGTPADAARIAAQLTPPPGPAKLTSTLTLGSSGPVVAELQRLLAACAKALHQTAIDPGPADGVFGKHTAAAVVAFKQHVMARDQASGHPATFHTADPFVGPKTLNAIRRAAG